MVSHRGKRCGADGSQPLNKTSDNQHADSHGSGKPGWDRTKRRTHAKNRHAEQQYFPPADVVGKPSHGNRCHGDCNSIAPEGNAYQKARVGKLQAVKREDRKHQKEPQHPQAYGAGQAKSILFWVRVNKVETSVLMSVLMRG